MILSNEEATFLYSKYTCNHRELHIYITNSCNMNCSICYMDSSSEKHDFIKKSYIKKILKYIDKNWCVCIIGGEPLLNIKIVKYICKLCKKKNIKTRLATNGKLLLDKKILKKVLSLKINVLSLGYNEYHSLKEEEVQKIIDIFADNNVSTKITLNSFESTDLSKIDTKGCFIIRDSILPSGRGTFKELPKFYESFCPCQGLALHVNGDLRGMCCYGQAACLLGNINDFNFENILNCLNRYPKFKWKKPVLNNKQCIKGSLLNKNFDNFDFWLTT